MDSEVQSMRLRELENAVGEEEKGTSTHPPCPKANKYGNFSQGWLSRGGNKPLNPFYYYPQSRLTFPKTPGNPASTLRANAVLTRSGRGGMGFFGGWVGEWERGGKVKGRVEGVRLRGFIEEPDEREKGGGGRSSKEACG